MGDFRVAVRRKARYVDEEKCTGCGECAEKCPTPIPDRFNPGLGESKAIYRYFAQGIPSVYTIDTGYCRQFQQGKKCGICAKTCQAKAVDYAQEDRIVQIEAGAVILATGYDLFDAARIPEYGYGRIPDVITALQLERLLSAAGPTGGHLYRPSDLAMKSELAGLQKRHEKLKKTLARFEKKHGQSSDTFFERHASGELRGNDYDKWADKVTDFREVTTRLESLAEKAANIRPARRLAFVQCVGSRDIRFNRHCSSFCCMHSIKQALIAIEHEKDTEAAVFGMDIRAVGKDFEQYRNRGSENGIRFVRGRVAEITRTEDGNPLLWYEDTVAREVLKHEADLAVLASACQPANGAGALAKIFGIEIDGAGYVKSGGSCGTSRPGVFTCGCAAGPADIPESVARASGAAARVAQALGGRTGK